MMDVAAIAIEDAAAETSFFPAGTSVETGTYNNEAVLRHRRGGFGGGCRVASNNNGIDPLPLRAIASGRTLMRDAEYFRKQARRCRALSKTVIQPEQIEQFRMWAVELAKEAEKAEKRAAKRMENRRGRVVEGRSSTRSDLPTATPKTAVVDNENVRAA